MSKKNFVEEANAAQEITETAIAPVEMSMADIARESDYIVSSLNDNTTTMYQSFKVETREDKVKLFNATSSEGETVKENLNKEIQLVDVVVMPVSVKDEKKGSSVVPRTTLITADGRYISATSWGVYNSIRKLDAIFGDLHFEEPLKIVPVEVRTKAGFTLNLKIV